MRALCLDFFLFLLLSGPDPETIPFIYFQLHPSAIKTA